MTPSAKAFYASRIENLAILKANNDPLYTENFNTFLELVFADAEFASKLEVSANKIHLLSGRLIQVDEEVKNRVRSIYEDLPNTILGDKKLKGRLYEAASLMFWNHNNRQIRETCKYMVVQLEMICEYLLDKYNIFDWAIDENNKAKIAKSREPYQFEKNKDNQPIYLKTGSKIKATRNYLVKELDAQLLDESLIQDIKEMRDFASHGYHQKTIDKKQAIFNKVNNGFEFYFQNWPALLKSFKEFLKD